MMRGTGNAGHRVARIVIAGGGTAGWMSAAYLARTLRGGCQISLVEPTDVGPIGVGEATVPTLRRTMKLIGAPESDWMRACNATFKLAIKFVDWRRCGVDDVFWHPFGGADVPRINGLQLSHHWLCGAAGAPALAEAAYPAVLLCRQMRAPKGAWTNPYEGEVDYAYHFDAIELARYLKAWACAAGVQALEGKINEVRQDERGFISGLVLDCDRQLEADFFVDCTGFRAVLIGETLQEPFESYARSLLCDAAVAMRVPYPSESSEIEPFTTATAQEAGWIWSIPLYLRTGTGYVYATPFLDADRAEDRLRRFVGPAADGLSAVHIKMRIGKRRRVWVRNCVAIGLAGGFIEPLESTGIYLTEMALHYLATHFPDASFDEHLVTQYNTIMTRHYEHVRDFIVLHYCTSERQDSAFWRAVREDLDIPSALEEKLALWKTMLPVTEAYYNPGLFPDMSYACLLAGMGHLPARPPALLSYGDTVEAAETFAALRSRAERLGRDLPSHRQFLSQLHTSQAARIPR